MALTREELLFLYYLYRYGAIKRQHVRLAPMLASVKLRRIARLVRRGLVRRVGEYYIITEDGRWLVEVLRASRLDL